MKRFLTICVAALAVLAISENRASAWSKCNFNIGLHISRESADNSFLWGLYRSGPHPFAHNPGAAAGYTPDVNPYQYYHPHAGTPGNQTLPAPGSSQSVPQAAQSSSQYNGQGATQPVGYWNNSNQYHPNTNWTPPSYWYGKN